MKAGYGFPNDKPAENGVGEISYPTVRKIRQGEDLNHNEVLLKVGTPGLYAVQVEKATPPHTCECVIPGMGATHFEKEVKQLIRDYRYYVDDLPLYSLEAEATLDALKLLTKLACACGQEKSR